MPRTRTVPDERILAAALTLIGARGLGAVTLADIAAEVGLGPSTLVQRFGSKRRLLLALAEGGVRHIPTTMRAAYDTAPDPLDGLRAALRASVAPELPAPEFAHHLELLHAELANEELRVVLADLERSIRAEIAAYLADAAAAGVIVAAEDSQAALVAAIAALRNGTQLSWAMTRDGTLADALDANLDILLRPWTTPAAATDTSPPVDASASGPPGVGA